MAVFWPCDLSAGFALEVGGMERGLNCADSYRILEYSASSHSLYSQTQPGAVLSSRFSCRSRALRCTHTTIKEKGNRHIFDFLIKPPMDI